MSEPVLVALITAVVGPTIIAMVTRQQIRRRVGRPNGKGNVVQMLETALDGQDEMKASLRELDERTSHIVDSHAAMVASQAGQDRRIAVLERDRPPRWATWAPVAAGAALFAAMLAHHRRHHHR